MRASTTQGTGEFQEQLGHLKRAVLQPALQEGPLGRLLLVAVNWFMTESRLESLTILRLFERGLLPMLLGYRGTNYYRRKARRRKKRDGRMIDRGAEWRALLKVLG